MGAKRVSPFAAAVPRRRIDLVEWSAHDVSLSAAEIADVLLCPSHVLQVRTLPGGFCQLRLGPVVGQLRVGSVDLRIVPKYPMPSLLTMLSEVYGLAQLMPTLVGYGTTEDVVDFLVQIFLDHVERVVRQGLKRTYIEEEEELVAVRGRIDCRRTVHLHLRGKPRAQCRFEDYTCDGLENGTLLAALEAIAKSRVLPVVRRNGAHQLTCAFEGVRPRIPSLAELKQVEYGRLNLHYYPVMQLARLILEGMGLAVRFGATEANGFLLDMNRLFQLFVYRKLEKTLRPYAKVSAPNNFSFDVDDQARIQPDLMIQSRGGRRLVADTKYKIGTKPDPGDLYQVLTYCNVLKVKRAILITVGGGDIKRFEVRDGITTIEVIPVDLSGSPATIDNAIRTLADHMRSLL